MSRGVRTINPVSRSAAITCGAVPPLFYPPTQKATPACRNACLPTGKHFGVEAGPSGRGRRRPEPMASNDECEEDTLSKLRRSVVGCASEGSALRRVWRGHGLWPVGLHFCSLGFNHLASGEEGGVHKFINFHFPSKNLPRVQRKERVTVRRVPHPPFVSGDA